MVSLTDLKEDKPATTRNVINRIAFAIQDETMTRLEALRYARAALAALEAGDRFNGLVVRHRTQDSEVHKSLAPPILDLSPDP